MATPEHAPALVWFRDDLRLADNPALVAACDSGRPVVALYVLESEGDGIRPLGAAAKWWLHHSLRRLSERLAEMGVPFVLRQGFAKKEVKQVAKEIGAGLVVWNRRYGAPATDADARVEAALRASKVEVRSFKANLLFEPDEVRNRSGASFRVFTPFWRAAQMLGEPRAPLPAPSRIAGATVTLSFGSLEALDLLPAAPDWTRGILAAWKPGEEDGLKRLNAFVGDDLEGYRARRDFPADPGTSRLSPHLRFGEVSPFQVYAALGRVAPTPATGKFKSELGWREFAYHVLGDFPLLAVRNLRPEFDRMPWEEPYSDEMWAWRRGRTGYPIVDAGMRQLWQEGWMHNRVRMIVASFLTKHLLVDWRLGEEWFWDTLVDADTAANAFNWQWVAGSGADAQPFFRIFNPVLQGEKFDPDGDYVRRYVPEIAGLPAALIHRPWEAPPLELAAAGIALGKDYPAPMVDHAPSRARALAAFAQIRQKGESAALDGVAASH